jgi:predicted RNA-binding Zn-ribbon protein involved in translation (DUF1610 family)
MASIVLSITLHTALAVSVLLVIVAAIRLRRGGSRTCAACGCRSVPRDPYIIYCPQCGRQIPRDALLGSNHHATESLSLFKSVWALMFIPFLLIAVGAACLVMLAMKHWR